MLFRLLLFWLFFTKQILLYLDRFLTIRQDSFHKKCDQNRRVSQSPAGRPANA